MSIQSLDQVSKVKGLESNKYILLQHANAFVFHTIQIPLRDFLMESSCCTATYLLQMNVIVVVVVLVQWIVNIAPHKLCWNFESHCEPEFCQWDLKFCLTDKVFPQYLCISCIRMGLLCVSKQVMVLYIHLPLAPCQIQLRLGAHPFFWAHPFFSAHAAWEYHTGIHFMDTGLFVARIAS